MAMTFRERMKRLALLERGSTLNVQSAWVVLMPDQSPRYFINSNEVSEVVWVRAGMNKIPVKGYVGIDLDRV